MTGPAPTPGDAGFVLMDGLIGLALVAMIGTAAVVVSLQMADRQALERDHSVALTMGRSLVIEYMLTEGRSARRLPVTDELFRYELHTAPADSADAGTVEVSVRASPLRASASRVVELPFLAPARYAR
jgi:hypothetical protein